MLDDSGTGYTRAYIGLGTNIGDRVKHLIDARQQLRNLSETQTLQYSSLYESSPVGYSQQADFINCVIELDTSSDEDHLFADMQSIETSLGRVRDVENQNAPRIIDLDLLLFGEIISKDKKLTIPHPRINCRLFVLQPLLELNPNLALPNLVSVVELIETGRVKQYFDGQTIRKLTRQETGDWEPL